MNPELLLEIALSRLTDIPLLIGSPRRNDLGTGEWFRAYDIVGELINSGAGSGDDYGDGLGSGPKSGCGHSECGTYKGDGYGHGYGHTMGGGASNKNIKYEP